MPVANIFIDSNDRSASESVNDFRISDNPAFRSANLSAIGLVEYQFQMLIPNINAKNNTFTVNVNATDYVITIPEGFYRFGYVDVGDPLVAGTFLSVLQERLRTITGEATFTVAVRTGTPATVTLPANDSRLFTITATPPFRIFNTTEQGRYVSGLYDMSVPSTSFNSRVATMLYTSFVDIICGRLHNYNVPDETSNYKSGNVLQRVYLGGIDLRGNTPEVVTEKLEHPKWIKWEPSVNLSVIDFQLRDQFGDLLYIPSYEDKLSFFLTFQAVDSDFNRLV